MSAPAAFATLPSCDRCGSSHAAELSHMSELGQGAIYAVVCPTDNLTAYYTTELLTRFRDTENGVVSGDTVKAIPVNGTRRQTFVIATIHPSDENAEALAVGYLVSKKSPGDYRGGCVAWLKDCQLVTAAKA